MKYAWVVGLLVACGGEKEAPPQQTAAPAPATPAPPSTLAPPAPDASAAPAGPTPAPKVAIDRVALGACAKPGTKFESGPKPARFDPLLIDAQPGTIGLGNLGKVGTGQGYGSIGGTRGRRVRVPAVTIGQPVVEGGMDKAIIRRYIRRNIAKITYCYERELAANGKLEGEVKTSFVITAIGAVQEAKASGVDPKVADCVKGVLSAIEFPKPQGSGVVKVQYPFKFRPPEDVEITVDATPYFPDERSPLRDHKAALAACFTQPFGVGVVELGPEIKVSGVDAAAAACITDVAKQVKDRASQVCSFAYGTLPVGALPGLDVDASAIRWNGAQVAEPRGDVANKVVEAVRATPRTGDVPIVGPIVVRADPKAPPGIVTQLVDALRVAGVDALVATKSGDTWKLPVDVDLPVVPVPVGTGTSWTAATRKQ